MISVTNIYKAYTDADKLALKELKAEVEANLGRTLSLSEIIQMVEPTLDLAA